MNEVVNIECEVYVSPIINVSEILVQRVISSSFRNEKVEESEEEDL